MILVYVAGRYRAPTHYEVARNIAAARAIGEAVCALGLNAYPLIPHCNTAHMDGLREDGYWLAGTMQVLRRCDCVLLVPGWESSSGTRAEIREAETLGKPVFHAVDDLADWLRRLS
jgi:hypothetical protein